VAGARPVVLDGFTGPEHGQRLLECLALLEPEPPGGADGSGLAQALAGRPLPDAPVLLLGVAPGPAGEALRGRLQRPLAVLAADALAECDFYEGPPAAPAAPGPDSREPSHGP
jgi:hypothetical protein